MSVVADASSGQLLLTDDELHSFHENGFLLKPRFFDRVDDIEPIQRSIHRIIGILIDKYRLPIVQSPFTPATFDDGFQALIAVNRRYGSEIYDAVKQIPAFVRLASSPKLEALASQIRESDLPGVCAGGYGIRIDNPREEQFRAPWHQDYTAQFRSIDGLVFWSPLAQITAEMGPVEICVGSHREGLVRVHTKDAANPTKGGAYALRLENEAALVDRYEHVAPLTSPGDLVILDFLVVHRSGLNRATRSRWSMQMRYFNFNHPLGQKIGWAGAYAAGNDVRAIHPDLFID